MKKINISIFYIYNFLSLLLIFIVFILILFTFLDYGLTVDEIYSKQYGNLILDTYKTLPHAESFVSHLENSVEESNKINMPMKYRGGTFHTVVQFFCRIIPLSNWGTRRLITALVGLLAVIGCMKLARLFSGPIAGFWSALFLLCVPAFYGHMYMNPSDIPFTACYIWSLYYIARIYEALPKPSLSLWSRLGLVFGLTFGVRPGGIIPVFYFFLMLCWYFLDKSLLQHNSCRTTFEKSGSIAFGIVLAFVVSHFTMILFWPAAILSPFVIPFKSIIMSANFPMEKLVLFNGVYVDSMDLPAEYIPHYMIVKLPLFLLLSFLGALIYTFIELKNTIIKAINPFLYKSILLWMSIIVPLAFSIIIRPVDYDAMRHYQFILPSMSCLAGIFVSRFQKYLAKSKLCFSYIFIILIVFLLSTVVFKMVQLHPYQYIYYNEFIGGVEGSVGKYQNDYWAMSYKEAAEKLVEYVKREEGTKKYQAVYRVCVCGVSRYPWITLFPFLPGNYKYVETLDSADFYVTIGKWPCRFRQPPGKNIVYVKRLGVTLSTVVDLRGSR